VAVSAHPRRVPADAQRRPPSPAVFTGPAPRAGAADDLAPHPPARDRVTDGHDPARELVTFHGTGAPPPFEDEVDVAAADAAVAHLEEHVVRPDLRDRAVLDGQLTRSLVHRDPHALLTDTHPRRPTRDPRMGVTERPRRAGSRSARPFTSRQRN